MFTEGVPTDDDWLRACGTLHLKRVRSTITDLFVVVSRYPLVHRQDNPKMATPISVLTLTYKRPALLEEAIESFLRQSYTTGDEMVVINDDVDVEYIYENTRGVRIINVPERFSSISAKIKWGYTQCVNEYIYRLDDDDLLAPNALSIVRRGINASFKQPGRKTEIFRSCSHYFFSNNVFTKISRNTNTGNCYTRTYLDRVPFSDSSFGEDVDLTYGHKGRIHTLPLPTMIYRWGGDTYHVSAFGNVPSSVMMDKTDARLSSKVKRKGRITLVPGMKREYYNQLPFMDKVATECASKI